MNNNQTKDKNVFKMVPWWGWLSGFVGFFLGWAFYQLSFLISSNFVPWSFCSKINVIDNSIPFCPYFFAEIYVLSYIFWIISPIAISACNRDNFYDFIFSYGTILLIACFICIICPTYMDRESEQIIDKVQGPGLSKWIMRLVYKYDGGKISYNLCPSSHCYTSVLCWVGVFRKKDIKLGYRIFSVIFSWLVVFSTVFVKQHYFIDTIGGITLAIFIYEIYQVLGIGKKFNNYILNKNKKER